MSSEKMAPQRKAATHASALSGSNAGDFVMTQNCGGSLGFSIDG
jgi:hypothetical protein